MKITNPGRRRRILGVFVLGLLTILSASVVSAQQTTSPQPAPEQVKSLPVEEISRARGKLLVKGANDEPVGPLKVKTYLIEEVKLPEPIEIHRRGSEMRVESVARLTITGEHFLPGSYIIWIGDDWPLDNVMSGATKLSVMIHNLSIFEEGLSISVAVGVPCKYDQRTTLPERLVVPEGLPEHLRRIPYIEGTDGNRIRIIRSLPDSIAVRGAADAADVEIILDTKMHFPPRNQITVLQIGDVEFPGDPFKPPGTLVFRLTAEQFARAPDGGRVKVKYGECSAGGVRFGRLDKSMLDRK